MNVALFFGGKLESLTLAILPMVSRVTCFLPLDAILSSEGTIYDDAWVFTDVDLSAPYRNLRGTPHRGLILVM